MNVNNVKAENLRFRGHILIWFNNKIDLSHLCYSLISKTGIIVY